MLFVSSLIRTLTAWRLTEMPSLRVDMASKQKWLLLRSPHGHKTGRGTSFNNTRGGWNFPFAPLSSYMNRSVKQCRCFMRFTSLFSYCSFLLIKMQPTDLAVAGCGVCMMLPGTILPPEMGVLFFWGYTSVIVLESAISRQAHWCEHHGSSGLRNRSVSGGTFPARRFTVSSR